MAPTDKAVVDRTRHDRLRALLPKVYATEPGTVLGALVELIGDQFRDLDRDLERAMRDKWLISAEGHRSWGVRVRPPTGWRKLRADDTNAARALAWGELLELEPRAIFGYPIGPSTIAVYDSPLIPAKLEAARFEQFRKLLARFIDPERTSLQESPGKSTIELWLTSCSEQALADTVLAIWAPVANGSTLILWGPHPAPGSDALKELVGGLEGVTEPANELLRVVDLTEPLPLELLGAALDLRRLPWESNEQAYRQRLRILAPLLVEGLGTPRAILSVATTSLLTEPCPRLERVEDSTTMHGLAQGALGRCRACRGGRERAGDPSECPQREHRLICATLIDNPRTPAKLTWAKLQRDAPINLVNDSLFSARPRVRVRITALEGSERTIVALRSRTTGEQLIIAHPLAPGEILHLHSERDADESARHLQHWVDTPGSEPSGAAVWIEGSPRVQYYPLFAKGPRFNYDRFAAGIDTDGARFTTTRSTVRTPELVPGDNVWVVELLGEAELLTAVSELGDDYRQRFAEAVENAAQLVVPTRAEIDLTVEWWTRPPGRFALQIPASSAVACARARGADVYLRQMIERVRPCGVFATIDFPSMPLSDSIEPRDTLLAVHVAAGESLAPDDALVGVSLTHSEAIEPADIGGWQGVFDTTRFDFTRARAPDPESE